MEASLRSIEQIEKKKIISKKCMVLCAKRDTKQNKTRRIKIISKNKWIFKHITFLFSTDFLQN